MKTDPSAEPRAPQAISRREALKRVALAGAAAAVPSTWAQPVAAATGQGTAPPSPPQPREAFESLTATESDTLEAIVARLIPTDENGPGASEARAAHYIDRALAGPLASSRNAYASGLAAIDAYARATRGGSFVALPASDQDAVLGDVEKNVATGFWPGSAEFFELVRSHTIEGMFCDPYYGGNANFIGWDLIGYPGLRLAVGPEEQRMGVTIEPVRVSAYDLEMFSKGAKHHGH